MRPLTILHTEWSNGWGGQEIRIVDEAVGITALGHSVLIVARPECRILDKAKKAGLPTRELEMRGSFDWRAVRGLRAIIRAEKADIVNTHSSVDSWIGSIAARTAGAKLIRTRHLSSNIPRHPFNVVYRLPHAVITTGETVRQQLIAHSGVKERRVVSIPTGVDVDSFAPRPVDSEVKVKFGIPPNVHVVSIVAVLRRFKRHDVFLEAASLLRRESLPCHFVLAGEGPQRPNIERLIRELNLDDCVTLLGHVEDVRPILSLSDVVVLTSDSGEGVPQAIAQALAMARPVVATEVGSVAELVKDEITGLLVRSQDAGVVASAIKRYFQEPALTAAVGNAGREHIVQNYSRKRMIEQTQALYERLLP